MKNGEDVKEITNFNRDNKKQTVHHDTVTHTVYHDGVTHQETTYTTETQTVERSGYIYDD